MGSSRPDNSSQMAQIQSNRETMRFIKQQTDVARGDVKSLFPQALAAQRAGFQGGLDTLQQAFPVQQQQFQQGNVAAQQALIDAQPGIEAALLGGVNAPPGTGPTQPFEGQIDTNFLQQALGRTPRGLPKQAGSQITIADILGRIARP